MEPVLKERFGAGAFTDVVGGMFRDMFTSKSDPAIARDVVARAQRLPAEIGAKVLLDLLRYDITRLETTLSGTKLPLMAIQTTFSNEKRERSTMRKGQMTPYLDTLRKKVPQSVIEIIPDTGHFPQLDEPNATTRLLSSFADRLS
jgi:pimeloyl-ACP methyl ester carboxylesterase